MKKLLITAAVLGAAVHMSPVFAADAAAGKGKYAICAGCHGPTGSGNEALGYPKLAGHDAAWIAEQLNAYKTGARDNATMKAMAMPLSDADVENVAAYIATLQ